MSRLFCCEIKEKRSIYYRQLLRGSFLLVQVMNFLGVDAVISSATKVQAQKFGEFFR
jgi:hypothetical protein